MGQWIGQNSDMLFRIGLYGFLFGVILMLIDKDFEKRFENNSFIRKAFALRMPFPIKIKTEPFGTLLSIVGIVIIFTVMTFAGATP